MANRDAESTRRPDETRKLREVQEIREALEGLQFGSITVIVQDGIVVQIDRTEKVRLVKPKANE